MDVQVRTASTDRPDDHREREEVVGLLASEPKPPTAAPHRRELLAGRAADNEQGRADGDRLQE
eukprot:3055378-Alexandrium_andersonii.AAC.1